MNISVIGTGYVGLVSGACLADMGNHVFCLDMDGAKIASLNAGRIPIYEPGLESVVQRNREAGRLRFSTEVSASVAHGVLQLIAVGTPPGEDGSADLQYVLQAAREIGRRMEDYRVIVNKSTVPVGTADKVRAAVQSELAARGKTVPFGVVSNPEFLKEGAAVEDFMRPDRIIIGSDDERATALLRELYAPFQRNHERMMVMGVRSAELAKYAANAMLATRISFMNELANLAEALGADIEEVRKGIGSDPRIGTHFLYPGAGFGGSCFPKDVRALQRTAQDAGWPLRVVAAAADANEVQKHVLGAKIRARFGEDLRGRTFALWGLAFKPNTDDMREAPSLTLIADLQAAGAKVRAYDPVAKPTVEGVTLAPSAQEALQGCDALAIVTEWAEFRSPDFAAVKRALTTAAVFDGRNLYDPAMMRGLGFEYFPIGRKP
ncbi:MAG: UDP-glucose/GDP-mannose dehydrogenase family protein [Proteobacteria bacterium]|nr:UDP-glucose/GDP-mannose dehydrogenase family protein [Pseudomonadota bacterium]MDA0983550.1 UDP-glucose/GDP-mannose dehydrogenase family protein [Pseudomonadota bacterium]